MNTNPVIGKHQASAKSRFKEAGMGTEHVGNRGPREINPLIAVNGRGAELHLATSKGRVDCQALKDVKISHRLLLSQGSITTCQY